VQLTNRTSWTFTALRTSWALQITVATHDCNTAIAKQQLQTTIAKHDCKHKLQNHKFKTATAKQRLQNSHCKTAIAKHHLQDSECKTTNAKTIAKHNCKTIIEKQQVLKQFFGTLRGTSPRAANKKN